MYDLYTYYDLCYVEPKIPIGLSSKRRLRTGSAINHIATSQKCQLQTCSPRGQYRTHRW